MPATPECAADAARSPGSDLSPFSGDAYATPPGSSTAWGRRLPSLLFRLKILNIIREAGNLASSAPYTGARWIQDSLKVLRALEDSGCLLRIEGMGNIDRAE
ncbi:MAG: hypothetical protein LBP61_00425, partial [Desulfovibrio sp.]|nr:hypothetical protein [Desulfovibrio sp.]